MKLKKRVYAIDPNFHALNARYSVNGANTLLKRFNLEDSIYFIYNPQFKSVYSQFENSNLHFPNFNDTLNSYGLNIRILKSFGSNSCYVIETECLSIVWLTGICNNYLTLIRDTNIIQQLKDMKINPDLLFLGTAAGIGPEIAHGIRETFIGAQSLKPEHIFVFGHELLEQKVRYQLTRLGYEVSNLHTADNPGDQFIINQLCDSENTSMTYLNLRKKN